MSCHAEDVHNKFCISYKTSISFEWIVILSDWKFELYAEESFKTLYIYFMNEFFSGKIYSN